MDYVIRSQSHHIIYFFYQFLKQATKPLYVVGMLMCAPAIKLKFWLGRYLLTKLRIEKEQDALGIYLTNNNNQGPFICHVIVSYNLEQALPSMKYNFMHFAPLYFDLSFTLFLVSIVTIKSYIVSIKFQCQSSIKYLPSTSMGCKRMSG